MKPFAAMFRDPTMTFPPLVECQSFFSIEAFHQVFTDLPALAVQQHPDLPVSIPHTGLSDLSDTHPERGARILMTAIPKGSSMQSGHSAGPPLADSIAVLHVLDELPAPRGL
jgi:hypothetical protein